MGGTEFYSFFGVWAVGGVGMGGGGSLVFSCAFGGINLYQLSGLWYRVL